MATSPPCRATKRYPDHGALSAIPIEVEAEPCPMQVGQTSTHTVTLSNRRPNNIYQVEYLAKSLFKRTYLDGSDEWLHVEPVIVGGKSHSKACAITARPGSQGSSDEIQSTVALYDALQRVSGADFSGDKEKTELNYILDII